MPPDLMERFDSERLAQFMELADLVVTIPAHMLFPAGYLLPDAPASSTVEQPLRKRPAAGSNPARGSKRKGPAHTDRPLSQCLTLRGECSA